MGNLPQTLRPTRNRTLTLDMARLPGSAFAVCSIKEQREGPKDTSIEQEPLHRTLSNSTCFGNWNQ